MGALGYRREVGLYTAAYAPLLWVASVVGVLRAAFLPEQSRRLAGDTAPRTFLGFYGRVSLWLALPVAVFGVLYAREFLRIVYGGAYQDATFALQLLSVTGALMFLSSFYGSNLVVQGRRREYLVCVGAGAAVNVALNLWLIPAFRLDGAAAVTLISEAAVMCCMWWQCRAILPLADIASFLKAPALASGLLVAVLLGADHLLPVPVALVIAGAAYLLAAVRLGVLEDAFEAPDLSRAA
jgi:O-antigen/teichoic acid export membrane protein